MAIALAIAAAVASSPPSPSPRAFVSEQYGLTFHTPPRSSYCALPTDWTGSDHGTVIFLKRPSRCYGVGYPSSGRGFAGDPPRIEVFYAYYSSDDQEGQEPPPCKEIARATFLGAERPLCLTSSRRRIEVSVSAEYEADVPAQASLTLVTSRLRLDDDLQTFRAVLESARTCTATWHDDKGGKPFTTGSGPACPDDAHFF